MDTVDEQRAIALLLQDLEFRIALHAPEHLFVHAAAVAWRGRVITIPGRTHSGKSTLSAALLRAGARYCSDEFTVLDAHGRVHAFPRPLQLRTRGGVRVIPAKHLAVVDEGSLPLGLVVHTVFRPGATWHPQRMSPGQTSLAILANAVVARTRPAHALARIARAVENIVGLGGPRGDADEAARAILAYADRTWSGGPDS